MPKWIWYNGDFEIYHSMLLHSKRERSESYVPPMWKIYQPEKHVTFKKTAEVSETETLIIHPNSDFFVCEVDSAKLYRTKQITLEPGIHTVSVSVYKETGFPCLYVEGNAFASDESWMTHSFGEAEKCAGSNIMYSSLEDNPEIFKFSYRTLRPVSEKIISGGMLYDFGRETFGLLHISAPQNAGALHISYGESEEEALDYENAVITDRVSGNDAILKARAFRFIFITPNTPLSQNTAALSKPFQAEVYAEEEYLPLERRGAFSSSDDTVNKIWDVCAHTLHLNMREGILDGVKRDRWVWSGDAYQSYFVNYYLFNDSESVKRTIRMLRGRDPLVSHLNAIPDYSMYWIMSICDYYLYTGDLEFLQLIYADMVSLMQFIISRLDENGLVVERETDFIFIDWAEFDREGPLCAEQMLLCAAYENMAKCCEYLKLDGSKYSSLSAELRKKINELYWDDDKGAFIDSFISGKKNVTRHANIFAVKYKLTSDSRIKSIVNNVLFNENVPKITTPYFKFFELDALAEIGDIKTVRNLIDSYWGDMIRLGATSIWEKFDPSMEGAEHYAMYGLKYEKSLCHAWGSSPIYLLGKYALGVRPTSPGYKTFDVVPSKMGFDNFKGEVPVPGGKVHVRMNGSTVQVKSDISGGILYAKSKKLELPAGIEVSAEI